MASLLDAAGGVASDPTVQLTSLTVASVAVANRTAWTSVDLAQVITGAATYALTNSSSLQFFSVGFAVPGVYRLRVNVSLSGGVFLSSVSDPFTVAPTAGVLVGVSCSPIYLRWQVAPTAQCTVTRLDLAAAAPTFILKASISNVTITLVSNDTVTFVFNVTVPSASYSANWVIFTATPPDDSILATSVNQQATTLVRLVTFPDRNAVFSCARRKFEHLHHGACV